MVVTSSATCEPTSGLLGSRAGDLVLRVCGTEYDGRLIRLSSPKCTIGSGRSCTLRLLAAGVRSLHCLILRGRNGTVIRRWSTGTYLNGGTFADAALRQGDRITVGPVGLEVVELPVGQDPSENTPVKDTPADGRLADGRLADGAAGHAMPSTAEAAEGVDVELLERRIRELEAQIASYDAVSSEQTPPSTSHAVPLAGIAWTPPLQEGGLQSQLDHFRAKLERERDAWRNERGRLETQALMAQQQIEFLERKLAARDSSPPSNESPAQRTVGCPPDEPDPAQRAIDATEQREELERREAEWQAEKQQAHDELGRRRAELEARAAELDQRHGELQQHAADLEQQRGQLEQRTAELEARAAELEQRTAELEQRTAEVDRRSAAAEQRSTELAQQAAQLQQQSNDLQQQRAELESRRHELDALRQQLEQVPPAQPQAAAEREQPPQAESDPADQAGIAELEAALAQERAAWDEQRRQLESELAQKRQENERLLGESAEAARQQVAAREQLARQQEELQANVQQLARERSELDRQRQQPEAQVSGDPAPSFSEPAAFPAEPAAPGEPQHPAEPAEDPQAREPAPQPAGDAPDSVEAVLARMGRAVSQDDAAPRENSLRDDTPRDDIPPDDIPPDESRSPSSNEAAAAAPANEAGGEEESIEAYMERLLNRVRGEYNVNVLQSPMMLHAPDREDASSHAASLRSAAFEAGSVPSPVVETAGPAEYLPRSQAPELSRDLRAMRALANESARTAIDDSAWRRGIAAAGGKFLVAAVAATIGGILLYLSDSYFSPMAYGAGLLFVLGLLLGLRGLLHARRSLAVARSQRRQASAKAAAEEPSQDQALSESAENPDSQ